MIPKREPYRKVVWAPQPGAQVKVLSCPVFEVLIEGNRGGGKRVADSTKILTNGGWKRADEVTYDDKLVSIDGSYTNIIGIFPSKESNMYKVKFETGIEILADAEHRWSTYSARNGYRDGWITRTTEDIKNLTDTHYIPLLEKPIQGKQWDGYDPYILGLILGDGCLTGCCVTVYNIDEFILGYLKDSGWRRYDYKSQNAIMMQLTKRTIGNPIKELLGRKTARYKNVPDVLKEADAETRLALVQGMMDSDGAVEKTGQCSYTTISITLAKDLQYLVRSLGGKATIHWKENTSTKALDGIGFGGYYHVQVMHCNKFNPFRMPRKRDRVKKMKGDKLKIISIERAESEPARCFSVDHPSHLFVIEDFIVTHNTDVFLMDFAQHVGKGWGESWKGIIFRETYPKLQDVIAKSNRWFRQIFPDATYNRADKSWRFRTGEMLLFRHARVVDDYWSYHGHEYPWIGWEELTNWPTSDLYMMMMSVCRTSNPDITVRRYISTTNPWGKGHNWVKNRFIDQAPPDTIIRETIKAESLIELGVPATQDVTTERVYIHSERTENLALMKADPNYVMNIAQNTNPSIQQAWIKGSWDILAGGMFDDLWDKKVHMIKPFMVPQSWKVYRAFDWGLSAPFSVGWWAISDGTGAIIDGKIRYFPRGTLIRIGEWYGWTGKPNEGLRLTNVQLGRGIRKLENKIKKEYDVKRVLRGPADASIFGHESDGEDIASKISKAFYGNENTQYHIFNPSNKASGTRVIGWQLIRDRLESAVEEDLETPHLYVFDTCDQFARTIRLLSRDEKNPDDAETDGEDHILDETRYMVLFGATPSEQRRYTLG